MGSPRNGDPGEAGGAAYFFFAAFFFAPFAAFFAI